VLPAFLLGHAHYTTTTVAPYLDYIATHKSVSIAAAWAHDPADGFPLDLTTLYRWFKRLAFRLTFLLVMLEKELLDLVPETQLAAMEKLIVKRATIRPRQARLTSSSPADTTNAQASALTLHALCQSNLWLTKQLLRTTDKLLHTPPPQKAPAPDVPQPFLLAKDRTSAALAIAAPKGIQTTIIFFTHTLCPRNSYRDFLTCHHHSPSPLFFGTF
jgi:hypothetical protein